MITIKKKEKTKPKKIKGFAIDENLYREFRDECKSRNISMSELISQFIAESTGKMKESTGDIVIKVVEQK